MHLCCTFIQGLRKLTPYVVSLALPIIGLELSGASICLRLSRQLVTGSRRGAHLGSGTASGAMTRGIALT
nr:hypothetical protein CFP56_52130 [Quercus suber]